MLGKLKWAFEVLRETWLVARVPPNRRVFEALRSAADAPARKGLAAYLRDRPARGRIGILRDWRRDPASGEARLAYSSSLFADGCLRIRPGRGRGVLVFLPGNMMGADDVLRAGEHRQSMTGVADAAGMALASWDWPLQGGRRERSLYLGLRSLRSAEREYSRFLPSLGTCLWREFAAELDFALAQVRRHMGADGEMHVVGWSMGACFAYVAPLLCESVGTTIAVGSCARVRDLVAAGETRRHGFFFYPLDAAAYFDLDDLVDAALAAKRPVRIVHGDRDLGCLPDTRSALIERSRSSQGLLEVEVVPGHGHVLSRELKDRIRRHLERASVRP